MRTIIKIRSSVPKEKNSGMILTHFSDEWQEPKDENELIAKLIDRVYPDYKPKIHDMYNIAISHKDLENCDMLISYLNEDIQIRIFYDHIATLRELSGSFLKSFYKFIIVPHKYSFFVNEIVISEAHNNNRLDEGRIALNLKDYIKRTITDKWSEFILFLFVTLLMVFTLIFTIVLFDPSNVSTLGYELASKCVAPFLASSILTGTNLFIYFFKLKSHTNIIWGHKFIYK
jgi:hypothetical protein